MTALHRKLLRELWQLRMQMLSIALVVATGVMTIVTMRGSYDSLLASRTDYYNASRFADVWAPLVRAPRAVARQLAALPGVAAVDTRITLLATLDLPGVDMPAQARFLSLHAGTRPLLNDVVIESGRLPAAGINREVLVSRKFAEARRLAPGQTIDAVINGRSQTFTIVGIASSPEFSYAVPPGSLLPQYERFGVFWVGEDFLGPAFDMDGAFNEAVLSLHPGVDVAPVLQHIDALLEPFGGLGAYAREDQLSHLILENELAEIRAHGSVIPAIFLAVSMFLLHQVLGRLVTTQRGEIAVLKAFGYTDAETVRHYLAFALLPVVTGAIVGSAGGIWLGNGLIALYGDYLELPDLHYRVSPTLFVIAIAASLLAAISGAIGAVARCARLAPAEAMRPESPASYRHGTLDWSGLVRLLPAAGRMILRNLGRRPLNALMSITGIALALAILVIGMFMFDSVRYLIDTQFRVIQREDVAVVFKQALNESVRHELARLPGVSRIETWRGEPARLRAGQFDKEIIVTALDTDAQLRRIVTASGNVQPLPADGILLGRMLADDLHVTAGDSVDVEWLDGERLRGRLRVAGIIDDYIGLSAYINKPLMNAMTGSSDLASGALLRTDGNDDRELFAQLKQTPAISGVSSPAEQLAAFDEQMAKTLTISSAFLLGFAGIIAFGVIYNSARIALAERSRELASLRVLGFHRAEVATLLFGEQAVLTLAALLPGCIIGYWTSWLITRLLASDTFRVPFVADAGTYVLASAIIALAALASTLAVRRRLDSLDLVSVLKERE